jgi:hypothetical protein
MTEPNDKANEELDDLELDAETVADLEPGSDEAKDVAGGALPPTFLVCPTNGCPPTAGCKRV